MQPIVKTKAFPHAKIYKHCQELFERKIGSLPVNDIHPAIRRAGQNRNMLFWYPDSYAELKQFCDDEVNMKSHGWIPSFTNQPFVIWYKRNSEIQLLPFNLRTCEIIKTASISTEIPFAFRYVARYKRETPVYICHDPLIAAILNSHYVQAVACGGDVVPQEHIKELVSLNQKLVYLGATEQVDAAATFVKQLSVYPDSVDIALHEDILRLLSSENAHLAKTLKTISISGDEFLFNRIYEKRRNRRSLSIDEEIQLTYQQAHPETQKRWLSHITETTCTREFGNACRLMSELLYANMDVKEATKVVESRYGVSLRFDV